MAIDPNKPVFGTRPTGPLKGPTGQSGNLQLDVSTKQPTIADASKTDPRAASRLKALARFNGLPDHLRDLNTRIRGKQGAIANSQAALNRLLARRPLVKGFSKGFRAPTAKFAANVADRVKQNLQAQQAELEQLKAKRVAVLAEKADDTPDGKTDAGHVKAKSEIAKLDGQIDKVQGDKLTAESKLATLEGQKQASVLERTGALSEQAQLKEGIAGKKGEVEKARKEIAGITTQIGDLKTRNGGLENENKKLFDQEQTIGAERRQLLGAQAGDQPLYDALKTLPADALTEGDSKFINDVDSRLARIATLTSDIGKLNQQQAANQSQVNENLTTIRGHEGKINGLTAQIKDGEASVKGLEGQLGALNNKLAELEKKASVLDKQVTGQQAEVNKVTTQLVNLEGQREKTVKQARGTEVQDIRLGEAQIERLDGEIGKVKGHLEQAKARLGELVVEQGQVRGQIAQTTYAVDQIKGQIDRLKGELTANLGKVKGNQDQIGKLETENKQLFGQEQALGKERLGLLVRVAEDRPLAEALRTLPTESLTDGDLNFLKDFDSASSRVTAINADVKSLNERQAANASKVAGLQGENEGLQGKIKNLEASIKQSTGQLAELDKNLKGLEGQLGKLGKDIAGVEGEIGKFENQLGKLEGDRGKWMAELEQDRKELQSLSTPR